MKLRLIAVAGLTAICLQGYAASTTDSSAPLSTLTNPIAQGSIANNSSATNTSPITLSTDADKISYALGVDIGRNFKNQSLPINSAAMAQGIDDGIAGGKTLMSPKDMQDTLINFQKQLISKHQAQLAQIGAQNKQDGDAFLAQNKTKSGVVTLADGLQYKVIKPGSGTSPTDQDTVTVNYVGTLPNGQVFDSSYVHGKPLSFPVSEVIPGWSEALKLMKPGAVWEIYVPAALAYGDRGMGPIGPNQTLIFKVELISTNATSATGSATPPPAPTNDNSSDNTSGNSASS